MKSNIALFDSTREEAQAFIQGLQDVTKLKWEPLVYTANQGRKNKASNLFRYIKYFLFPFTVFLQRKKYDKIVGWQAFYGLLFAFYCRLFHVKKTNILIIKNFIYKPKKGAVGKIYFKFMQYIVKSCYVDAFICSSKTYCDYCANVFQENRNRFVFIPFGINDFTKQIDMQQPSDNDYILSLGRSNRDWQFLIDGLADTPYQVRIICDELHCKAVPSNMQIYHNVWGSETFEFIRNCKCMILPIMDGEIVSGETVLLQAMSFSKPIIITKPSCLANDYVIDGYNALVVEKNTESLLQAVKQIYQDDTLYHALSCNSRKTYQEKHSLYAFGQNVGALINLQERKNDGG